MISAKCANIEPPIATVVNIIIGTELILRYKVHPGKLRFSKCTLTETLESAIRKFHVSHKPLNTTALLTATQD